MRCHPPNHKRQIQASGVAPHHTRLWFTPRSSGEAMLTFRERWSDSGGWDAVLRGFTGKRKYKETPAMFGVQNHVGPKAHQLFLEFPVGVKGKPAGKLRPLVAFWLKQGLGASFAHCAWQVSEPCRRLWPYMLTSSSSCR